VIKGTTRVSWPVCDCQTTETRRGVVYQMRLGIWIGIPSIFSPSIAIRHKRLARTLDHHHLICIVLYRLIVYRLVSSGTRRLYCQTTEMLYCQTTDSTRPRDSRLGQHSTKRLSTRTAHGPRDVRLWIQEKALLSYGCTGRKVPSDTRYHENKDDCIGSHAIRECLASSVARGEGLPSCTGSQ
jgi:hypothetical protein